MKKITMKLLSFILIAFFICNNLCLENLNSNFAYGDDELPSPYKYYFIPGYFAYWVEPWLNPPEYFYDEWGSTEKASLGYEVRDGRILDNVRFTPIHVPHDYQVDEFILFTHFEGDSYDVENYPSEKYLNMVKNHYTLGARIENEDIYKSDKYSGQIIESFVTIALCSPNHAHNDGENVYKTYIDFVVKFVENAYVEDPEGWEKEHYGVTADLEIDCPDKVSWDYIDFNDNIKKDLDIELDASNSKSPLSITSYIFSFKLGKESFKETNETGIYNINKQLIPKNINYPGENKILLNGEVTVSNKNGKKDTVEREKEIELKVINRKPHADYSEPEKMYCTVPFEIVDESSDPEDDLKYMEWQIKNSNGDLIFNSEVFLDDGTINTDFLSEYFNSAECVNGDLHLDFKKSGNYNVELFVRDRGDSKLEAYSKTDTYKKTIYVNTEPQPPIANFSMYEYGFVDESIKVTDTSTDPNDDIVKWEWTKPTVNKIDNTPTEVTGSLKGKGGNLTFKELGEYDTKLKVTDYTNLSDEITKSVKIIPPFAVARIDVSGTLKENRKVILSSKGSLAPSSDPIQVQRNIWEITPLDGQDPEGIKIDTATSNKEIRNVVFKEKGRYKVYLKVYNNYADQHQTEEYYKATYIEEIITIEEDKEPIADFSIVGNSPNFVDNPVSTVAKLTSTSKSIDSDIIDKYHWVIYRDNNENNDFTDDGVYNTFDVSNFELPIEFEALNSGNFKAELTVKEKFGQPTIEKFITEEDKRTNTVSKIFSINWIPQISFDLPEFAYTDDFIDITTFLKDENIFNVNVIYTIKRADELETSVMESVSLNEYTENSLDRNGGKIRFKESGLYELTATVIDEKGQSSTYSEKIRIHPLPTAVISDEVTLRWNNKPFQTKENRKYKLNGNASYANDYYSAELHPIDHSKDYWEIVPLDNQNLDTIKVQNGRGGALRSMGSSNILIQSNNPFDETLLLKQDGKYKIRYQVTNTYGKKSPFAEEIITVSEDTLPNVSFEVLTPTYRDKNDSKRAELTAYNIKAISNDKDNISIKKIRYRFDTNNDGNFENEKWKNTSIKNGKVTMKETHVGKYQFELMAREEFGQETIPEFITADDKKENYTYKIIEIDNMSPTISFNIVPEKVVDVLITVGEVDNSKKHALESKVKNYITTYLQANVNNINIQTQIIEYGRVQNKSFEDIYLNDVEWRENSERFIINLSDDNNFLNLTRHYEDFDFTGDVQTFEAPLDGTYILEIWGAQGGDDHLALGGRGGYSKGEKNLKVGDFLYVYVGGKGPDRVNGYSIPGGWNGGGWGRNGKSPNYNGASGGGATDIRLINKDINNRIIVAGGGGGGCIIDYTRYVTGVYGGETKWIFENGLYGEPATGGAGGGLEATGGGFEKATYTVRDDSPRLYITPTVISKNHKQPEYFTYGVYGFKKENLGQGENGGGCWSAGGGGGYIGGRDSDTWRNTTAPCRNASGGKGYIGGVKNGISIAGNKDIYEPDGSLAIGHTGNGFARIYTPIGLESINSVLAPVIKDDTHFIGLGNQNNINEMKNFIKGNDNKGTYISNSNINTALQNAAKYIANKLKSNTPHSPKYILQNEQIDYKLLYNDVENDKQMNLHNWRYKQQICFDNSLGLIQNNNKWLSNSINMFDKVGKYTVEYKTKDEAIKEKQFSNYNKWSILNESLTMYVHRKPTALFAPKVTVKNGTVTLKQSYKVKLTVEKNKKELQRYYYQANFKVPDGWILDSIEYKTPRFRTKRQGKFEELKVYSSLNYYWRDSVEYIDLEDTRFQVLGKVDLRKYNLTKASVRIGFQTSRESNIPPLDEGYFNFYFVKDKEQPTSFTVDYTDKSYDLDHTTRGDKGIVKREWSWKKEGETNWRSGQLKNGEPNKDYLVRLRVKDMEGTWSDYMVSRLGAIQLPPVAQFMLSRLSLSLGETLDITDLSYDPDGDDITEWKWKLYKGDKLINEYTDKNPQTAVNNDIKKNKAGKYKLTLQVKDSSGEWGDKLATSKLYTQYFTVAPINHPPTADFNMVSAESPSWKFPKTI